MDILKDMVGLNVTVVLDLQGEEYIDGKLKQVDSKGILIKESEDIITYVNHHDYAYIWADRQKQESGGVMSAFRKQTTFNSIFD